ncbi:hypothetical protein TorRG33x02_185640 [Trema orientale]|uniref:Uncharacterized protein n=1 Tax=Trema orientale TaxID=63057 RepID=A0A2P5EJH5_TREOI|nr:hypothetical protein TorRG33x02_185640 [Trema orientale]
MGKSQVAPNVIVMEADISRVRLRVKVSQFDKDEPPANYKKVLEWIRKMRSSKDVQVDTMECGKAESILPAKIMELTSTIVSIDQIMLPFFTIL